tara:strand:+ start:596 stop:913 length:318 start_codon:yes stop_codon:yes gene_type:complete
MIKLLKFLTQILEKEQLYELAMFVSDHPDIIDQETLLHIVNEVNGFENKPEYKEIEEHFKKIDDSIDGTLNIESSMNYDDFIEQRKKGQQEMINKLLRDNNISLN